MSNPTNRHLLVQDWPRRRYAYQQLLGKFLWQARAQSGESGSKVWRNARELGQEVSKRLISDVESWRDADPADEHMPTYQPGFWPILFQIWYHGYSLAQFEDYLRTGALRDATDRERANADAQMIMALPESDRQQVEDFIAYRYQQSSARALDPTADATPPTRRTTSQPSHRPATVNEVRRLDVARGLVYSMPDD